MRFFSRLYSLRSAALLPLVFSLHEAGAQTVSVAFSPVADAFPVPLSPWLIGLTGLMLLFFAWRGLGKRLSGHGWPLVAILSLGALAFGTSKTWLLEANAAVGVTAFDLVFPSPVMSPNLALRQDIAVTNTTGLTVRIDDIEPFENFLFYLSEPSQNLTQCKKGLILPPNAVCYFKLYISA